MFNKNNQVNFVWHLYAFATLGFTLAAIAAVFGILYLTKYVATIPREHQVFRVYENYEGCRVPDSLKSKQVNLFENLSSHCQISKFPEDCIDIAKKSSEDIFEIKTFSYILQMCSVTRNGELHNCTNIEPRSPQHIRIRDSLIIIAKQAKN